ncbi:MULTISPECIES: pentapeptide repeat-containing protein [unclassified Coleofasciculus]|uniref:pentapeptide repeat-containing protein n=1 Tax=unclassified Coleofasciculus TaxID=2692782 RepID=UPI00187E4CB5|nr:MULTISPECIES: pentapeptide repeat-containing protein [unclassified Coleofasciculus]MBE9126445.1 pentapeptide repeat-containing protein [Coleofasciculus sp. LEGE 07081]MBE9148047.1 pentapeptide repeat-containing protein [Coleofasciculus sp. LEGE 07092]
MKRAILATAALITATNVSAIATAENLQHIQQLLSTKDCSQCDLQNAGLVMAELVGANLSGADLSRANLSRANLMGADLTQANLSGASLNGANLAGANLSGAILEGTDLRDAYLANAQLFGTNLSNAYIQGTIGIPQYAGTAEDFYAWGVIEAERGNYNAAIEKYNQALSIKSDFAPAFLARGVARFRLGDEAAATSDAQIASQLFTEQNDPFGYQASQNLIQLVELALNPPEVRERPSLGNALVGIGSLLLRFLSPL